MPDAPYESFLAGLAAGLLAALSAYALRRRVWQLFAGGLRVLTWPFRPLIRLFARSKKLPADTNAPSAAAAAAVSRHQTLTDTALGDDFEHEESFILRQGLFFRWMMVRVGYMRMPEELTRELAEDYKQQAHRFLGGRVPIGADPRALYEDVEGAVLAAQFHESERGALYLLNESRKLMNNNVRKLAIWFSGILGAVLLFNIVANDIGLVRTAFGMQDIEGVVGGWRPLVFGAGSCVFAALLMWALYYAEYSPYQRNTARETANFLTRYLARVNDHYRTAIGRAKSVTVGQERDTKSLAEEARLWSLTIPWIALRVFFLETYVRNVTFQIRRNSSYYLIFMPAACLAVLGLILGGLATFTELTPFRTMGALGWVFGVLFLLVAALYVFLLSNSMRALEEIDQGEWISFHTLKLDQVMGEVVSKYAEDVGYWKNRVGGGL